MQTDDRYIFKSPFQSSEDYGNGKITQHALKASRACKMIKLDTIGKKNEKSFESGIALRDTPVLGVQNVRQFLIMEA